MSGMPLVTKVALWVGSFCVGSFVAGMVVIMEALAALRKGPSAVFYMKKRPAPPACMQDPSLGVHGYAHLEVVYRSHMHNNYIMHHAHTYRHTIHR